MTKSKANNVNEPTTVAADESEDIRGALKMIGGSQSDHWNNMLASQVLQALWVQNLDVEERNRLLGATVAGMAGVGPKDELEGMMAAQLIASSSSSRHGTIAAA